MTGAVAIRGGQPDEVEVAALLIALAALRAPVTTTTARARQPWTRPTHYTAPTSWRGAGRSPR
ncbi:acyl-CoA carboxylase epsilon subunit-like protein [Saccharothrix carnea]|uniref:Acyl-CoA carboxylase epsilon subunit-like protein n=1 Tax=Saccharothrix carnea TaxID=1280637 RepID=A0A2P8IFI9_SACCR|nr:acyl-CoA carboxylase epsilon subunit [Saccharothrix carnea]PSL57231.1 acyl-CoA carboxylase epsilon subunit-like protein [Saccharothrix carnea]